jgi:hypothetical protein
MVGLANRLLRTSDDRVGKVVLFSLNAVAKRDIILALTEIAPLSLEEKTAIKNYCTEYDRLRVLRNDIVHGRWDALSEAGMPILHTSSSRASLKERFEEKEVSWLIRVGNDIEKLVGTSIELYHILRPSLPTLYDIEVDLLMGRLDSSPDKPL